MKKLGDSFDIKETSNMNLVEAKVEHLVKAAKKRAALIKVFLNDPRKTYPRITSESQISHYLYIQENSAVMLTAKLSMRTTDCCVENSVFSTRIGRKLIETKCPYPKIYLSIITRHYAATSGDNRQRTEEITANTC